MASLLPDTDNVVACVEDIFNRVQSIAQFERRTILAYDPDDLAVQTAGIKKFPAAGVCYEGLKRSYEQSSAATKSTARIGASMSLVVTIIVIQQSSNLVNVDTKKDTLRYLTALRQAIAGSRAPSGHFWEFMVEAAASPKNNMVTWLQRWQVPVQMQLKG